MNIKAVLLAAGESSRFWPLSEDRHKSTLKICGKPIILWTIESLVKAGIKDFVVVQSPKKDVEKVLRNYALPEKISIKFVIQEDAKGMGDAVEKAKEFIDDYFLILNPNHFDAHEFVIPLIERLKKTHADGVLLGKKTDEPWNYGVFVFENGKAKGIIEKPERGKEPSNIRVIGIYLLSKKFFDYHKKVEKHHYSFEDALDQMMKNENVEVVITEKSTVSLKYTWHLLDFTINLIDYVFEDAKISENANISEKAVIEGKVIVEEGVKIFENAVIKGPCYIGRNTIIGNNALVRASHLGDGCIAGANSEIARSVFLDNAHVHSGYFGDTILAEGVRVGAGTVFANVRLDRKSIKAVVKGRKIDTGRKSFGGVVGKDTRIGINCSIMPGVHIGCRCMIGPAMLVRENIPSDTVYFQQPNIAQKQNSVNI